MGVEDPKVQSYHQGGSVHIAGEPLKVARAAMLMVHGRGAGADDILSLVPLIHEPGFAYLAPQAFGNTWYPQSFLVPLAENEPWLSSALAFLADTHRTIEAAGIPAERTIFLGFSQGACLALEYAARHARRYGGVAGLSGALIGPPELPRNYAGSLAGTPVFLGCSDADFYVPRERVDASADILRLLGADVAERLYPQMGHTTNQDELDSVRLMMQKVLEEA